MKKTLFVGVVAFFMATFVGIAQNNTEERNSDFSKKIRFAVKAGGSISAIGHAHASDRRFPGINAGIAMQMLLQKGDYDHLFFTPEVMYASRGEKGFQAGKKDLLHDFYLDYISVPLMLKAYFLNSRLLFAEFGPEVNFLASQKNKDIDMGEAQKVDFGLNLGGGINFGNKKQIELGARLNYGLTKVYPDYKYKSKNSYNIGGQVTLTYFFCGTGK